MHQIDSNALQLMHAENNEPRQNAARREGGHIQVTGRSTGTGGAQGERRTKRRKKQEDGGPAVMRIQEGAA